MERPSPALTGRTATFWRGGAEGQLRISRCRSCGWWLHPPLPVCRRCHGTDIGVEATSGHGQVWSYTINRYQWAPGMQPPYVIAEVELDAQPGLRLLTTIVDCDDVRIGMAVSVRFEPAGEAWVPVFAPDGGDGCEAGQG